MREQLVLERELMRLEMEREAMYQEQQANMRAVELEKEANMRAVELEKEANMRAVELMKQVGARPHRCPGRTSARDPSPPSRSMRVRRESLRTRTPSPQSPSPRLTSSGHHQQQHQYPQSLTEAAQHYVAYQTLYHVSEGPSSNLCMSSCMPIRPPLGSTASSPRSPISEAGASFEGDRLDASIIALRAAMDASQPALSLSHSPVSLFPRSNRQRSRVKVSPATEARHM